jgi:hypothetical protein
VPRWRKCNGSQKLKTVVFVLLVRLDFYKHKTNKQYLHRNHRYLNTLRHKNELTGGSERREKSLDTMDDVKPFRRIRARQNCKLVMLTCEVDLVGYRHVVVCPISGVLDLQTAGWWVGAGPSSTVRCKPKNGNQRLST